MSPMPPSDTVTSHIDNEIPEIQKYSRQSSIKRRNPNDDEKVC